MNSTGFFYSNCSISLCSRDVGFLSKDRKASRWLEDGDSRGIISETVSMQLRSMFYSIRQF